MHFTAFLLNLTAAIVLLLYSTRMVRTGVERAFGAEMRNVFMMTRRNTVLNVLAGTLAAALLQSSTAVALLVSGFAIDRSKKYIKTIKIDMKIDAVDRWAAADNPPPTPDHNGKVYGTLQPPKPRQIVRMVSNVDACTILPQTKTAQNSTKTQDESQR